MAKILKKAKIEAESDIYHFPLRLKKTTAKKVRERADSQSRSFNGQVEFELNEKP